MAVVALASQLQGRHLASVTRMASSRAARRMATADPVQTSATVRAVLTLQGNLVSLLCQTSN